MSVVIYHNPRCSKSRQTLELIREHGIEPEVIEYLKSPPTKGRLKQILKMLGMKPRDLMRRGEEEYKALGLADESLTQERLIDAMLEHPGLIERPIVVNGDKAVLGRPPESVLKII
jgi:arsenate reductase